MELLICNADQTEFGIAYTRLNTEFGQMMQQIIADHSEDFETTQWMAPGQPGTYDEQFLCVDEGGDTITICVSHGHNAVGNYLVWLSKLWDYGEVDWLDVLAFPTIEDAQAAAKATLARFKITGQIKLVHPHKLTSTNPYGFIDIPAA